ncbi:MAG: cytochrome P450 [Pseudomonadota bacterium]
MTPPKPVRRAARVSFWRHLKLFREDILSSQPERLFGAKMAEFRTPFFRSFLVNEPALWRTVLTERPEDFPKSDRVGEGLRPLLGRSIFVTNGQEWARQRRIIDPAFAGGRLKESFAPILAAAERAADGLSLGVQEIEEITARAAADVIFRALFSVPIEDKAARAVFEAFRAYQRTQPILNLGAALTLPAWVPRGHRRSAKAAAAEIRSLISSMCRARQAAIAAGTAPDDLATKIMTTVDPETGARFTADEMADQVAIFFLAGHETSASVLAWALYLLATHEDAQDRVAGEAARFMAAPSFASLSDLPFTRDVFREALRLYPPVPMMVRSATKVEHWRKRDVPVGSQIVISPWHLQRHTDQWADPDSFRPERWAEAATKESQRNAYMPFSAGPRICPGAGFALAEGVVMLAAILARFTLSPHGPAPRPVAHLTLRSAEGIYLALSHRNAASPARRASEACLIAPDAP